LLLLKKLLKDCDEDDGEEEEEEEEEDEDDGEEEDEEGVNVVVGPLFGVEITKFPLESVAVNPNGFVYKLLLLED
jgi:hypothetical protein